MVLMCCGAGFIIAHVLQRIHNVDKVMVVMVGG